MFAGLTGRFAAFSLVITAVAVGRTILGRRLRWATATPAPPDRQARLPGVSHHYRRCSRPLSGAACAGAGVAFATTNV